MGELMRTACHSEREEPSRRREEGELSRRDFLRLGASAGFGLTLGSIAKAPAIHAAEPPRIRSRPTLGRTGLVVPDIGFGSFALRGDERLVLHALERGITHFDTAESYSDGEAERTLGRALRGRRDQVTLTSKYAAQASDSADEQMAVLERSLRRLQTDHIDLYLNHAVNDVARLQNAGWLEFVERAKAQGKIRFAGMSGHGPRLGQCLEHALDRGIVDAVLVAYNFSQEPGFRERLKNYAWDLASRFDVVAPQQKLPALLHRAHAQGVGVMVMKTLKGARLNDMRPYEVGGASFAQAAMRWVLSVREVDALVVTMKSTAMVDEYVAASGWRSAHAADFPLLARYEALNGSSQCQPGCGACAGSCPHGVPISDVLRARMYQVDYGEPALAAQAYAALGADASACLSCAEPSCLAACPSRIDIQRLGVDAHWMLRPAERGVS
jgi:predicted aldo/keto reductase-like oxidoreductase